MNHLKTLHRQPLFYCIIMLGLITLGHYTSGMHEVAIHNVYRRLYYIPVVLAAFSHGMRGGLVSAGAAILLYVPHAFLMAHQDPAPPADKVIEMVLYVIVGGLTGWLVEREREISAALTQTLLERSELERELVRAAKLGAIGELLAGVAHEVRNPLASILGAAEGITRQPDLNPKTTRLVALQLREAQRLDRVVSNFLEFARVHDSQVRVVDVKPLVEQVIELVGHHAQEGAFTVDPSVEGAQVMADEDHLSQMLLNLTLNALQATPLTRPFEVTFTCDHRTIAGKPHLCVGVKDRGEGVDDEDVERIFEPFFTNRAEGTGLGLSISSRLAEAHGGHLQLDQSSESTAFWICLPLNHQETP